MRGGFLAVWDRSWKEIWVPVQALSKKQGEQTLSELLSTHNFPKGYKQHNDLYIELFREVVKAFTTNRQMRLDFLDERRPEKYDDEEKAVDIANDPDQARDYFQNIPATYFQSELSLVSFFENVYEVFEDFDDLLAERYHILLNAFIGKYNLRYELVKPCRLYPTLPGIFSSLLGELSTLTAKDDHLHSLILDFNSALRDFKPDQTDSRIRNCIHKLINFIEALSLNHPNAKESPTLGKACGKLKTWPHITVQRSLSSLYGFSSDYPGIRHGGKATAKQRDLEMRDLIALSIILAGYTPYLAEDMDFQSIYLSSHPIN